MARHHFEIFKPDMPESEIYGSFNKEKNNTQSYLKNVTLKHLKKDL